MILTARVLADAMEAHATEHESESNKIDALSRTMTKPGERRTKDELARKSRNLSQISYHLRSAIRAMRTAGLV